MEYKMDIRSDLVKSAVLEYIDETFANMEFNISNAGSLVIAKIFVDKLNYWQMRMGIFLSVYLNSMPVML